MNLYLAFNESIARDGLIHQGGFSWLISYFFILKGGSWWFYEDIPSDMGREKSEGSVEP